MIPTKLYPDAIRFFATLEDALAYAVEVDGYRQLWMAIVEADCAGLISDN